MTEYYLNYYYFIFRSTCMKVRFISFVFRAGKLLTELSIGTGPVTDVEFHPHEFLLAGGCKDRTVSFWDLEKFACIGSSERESGPIKCIYFDPELRLCCFIKKKRMPP